jgi:hypothetical protein
VHALLKSGFNRNLDCPMKPLLVDVTKRIIGSSNDLTDTKNCLNYLSLLVSCNIIFTTQRKLLFALSTVLTPFVMFI